MTRSTDPLGQHTSYGYDALFLTSVQDAKGQRYGTVLNALAWVH